MSAFLSLTADIVRVVTDVLYTELIHIIGWFKKLELVMFTRSSDAKFEIVSRVRMVPLVRS